MEKSEQISELAQALVEVQKVMQAAKMTSTNPFLNNKYANLGDVIEAARKPLTDNGLAISQMPGSDGSNISLSTLLMHKSGQWLMSTISMPLGEEKGRSLAQSAGAIITYLRRYGYASMIGAYADEDTDGNAPKKAVVVEVRDGAAYVGEEEGEMEGPVLAEHPYADYVLNWKKAKELTGKDKPTLQDIYDTGALGIDYLQYQSTADLPSDNRMRAAVDKAQHAIREYLKGMPKKEVPPSDEFKIRTTQWSAWVKALAEQVPYYAAYGGGPDTYHIIGSLKKLGYTEFTDENANELKAILKARAEKAEEDKRKGKD